MPNMGFRGIYAGANSNFGGRITGGDILPAARGGFLPTLNFRYLNPIEDYFKYSTLILKAVGANTQQNYTFLDSSPSNLTVTRNGDVNQGTFSPYSFIDGSWSTFLDGAGDYTVTSDNAALEVGSSSFTLECWFYITGSNPANGACILAKSNTSSYGPYSIAFSPSGALAAKCSTNGSTWDIDLTSSIAFSNIKNTWNHVALVRSGSSFTLYFNGVSVATATNAGSLVNNAESFRVGNINFANTDFPGYISNVRLVTGTAVYTSAFTPPTTPLTAISGTALLTCQSNRFKDNSTNNLTVSSTGNIKISAFSPFNPTAEYAAAVNSGSLYFDGTGDYLTSAYNTTSHDWWPSDYTIEAWIYPTTLTGWTFNTGVETPTLVGNMNNANDTNYWSFGPLGNGTVRFYYFNGSIQTVTSSAAVLVNQWNHIAMTKTSSGITIFVNGVASTTTAVSGTPQSSAGTSLTVGRANNSAISGYVSNLRIVKGTSLYSSSFTPPTTPLTAVTNTTYLLNGTNAGIIDVSRKNNIYTAGSAAASTVQKKFSGENSIVGAADAYMLVPATQDLEFGDGNFTIEMWWYPTSTTRQALYHGSFGIDWSLGIDYNGLNTNYKIGIWASSNGSSWNLINADFGGNGIGTTTVTQNAWNHIAFVRNGTTWMLFVNGNRDLNLTGISGSVVSRVTYPKAIGTWFSSTAIQEQLGYLQDVRFTKGYARYTANFTVPGAPF